MVSPAELVKVRLKPSKYVELVVEGERAEQLAEVFIECHGWRVNGESPIEFIVVGLEWFRARECKAWLEPSSKLGWFMRRFVEVFLKVLDA